MSDNLRPIHYGGASNPYEVFNVLEAWDLDKDFYLGNVIKYIARAGKKDPAKEIEDLEKARVYLDRRINQLKNNLGIKKASEDAFNRMLVKFTT